MSYEPKYQAGDVLVKKEQNNRNEYTLVRAYLGGEGKDEIYAMSGGGWTSPEYAVESCRVTLEIRQLVEQDNWTLHSRKEKPWEPVFGGLCWSLSATGDPFQLTWGFNDATYRKWRDFIGVYPTKEKAEAAAEKIKQLLQEMR